MNNQNKMAVITGATSGIGAEFAKRFASLGYNLLITGRREDKINAVAQQLIADYHVNVEVMIVELTHLPDIETLIKKVAGLEKVDVLINNAGFGVRGGFAENDLVTFEDMTDVLVVAPMKLTHTVLPKMIANKSGSIINVSSIGGFIPLPNNSIYVASKAFVNLFSETLCKELKGSGVRVQTLCPGPTDTDFFERMGENARELTKKRGWPWVAMSSEQVVNMSLKYLEKNRVICIPSFTNKLLVGIANCKRFFAAWR